MRMKLWKDVSKTPKHRVNNNNNNNASSRSHSGPTHALLDKPKPAKVLTTRKRPKGKRPAAHGDVSADADDYSVYIPVTPVSFDHLQLPHVASLPALLSATTSESTTHSTQVSLNTTP